MVLPLLQYRDYLKTDFSFRVEIWTDGELYYSTDQKLNRAWICFSESGKVSDTSIESGYLLLPYNSDLECADDQLERVNYDLELFLYRSVAYKRYRPLFQRRKSAEASLQFFCIGSAER